MKKLFFALLSLFLFSSCEFFLQTDSPVNYIGYTIIDCPDDIANRAFRFAELYSEQDTVYEWGGQDPLRSVIGIDCSGLVIMCYKYAMVDTVYELLSKDMTAQNIHDKASRKISIDKARRGDLVFIGSEGSNAITHIALFEKYEDGKVYIIDSSSGDNGVYRNEYNANSERLKGYGIMKIKY